MKKKLIISRKIKWLEWFFYYLKYKEKVNFLVLMFLKNNDFNVCWFFLLLIIKNL